MILLLWTGEALAGQKWKTYSWWTPGPVWSHAEDQLIETAFYDADYARGLLERMSSYEELRAEVSPYDWEVFEAWSDVLYGFPPHLAHDTRGTRLSRHALRGLKAELKAYIAESLTWLEKQPNAAALKKAHDVSALYNWWQSSVYGPLRPWARNWNGWASLKTYDDKRMCGWLERRFIRTVPDWKKGCIIPDWRSPELKEADLVARKVR